MSFLFDFSQVAGLDEVECQKKYRNSICTEKKTLLARRHSRDAKPCDTGDPIHSDRNITTHRQGSVRASYRYNGGCALLTQKSPSCHSDVDSGDSSVKFDDEFVKTVWPRLLRVAKRLARNEQDAEDLVQTTLKIGLEKLPPELPESKRVPWLIRTLTNQFIDNWRKRRDRPIDSSVDVNNDIAAQPGDSPPRWAKVTAQHLERAVEGLDPDLKETYELHARGFKYREIASELGIPINTVGTRLRRARLTLRDRLLQEDG